MKKGGVVNQKVTILYVEDDEVDVMAAQRAMKHASPNFSLMVAKNGRQALDYLHGNTTDCNEQGIKISRPYIVVLDLNMPEMDGHEFLNIIRDTESLQDSVVFVLSTSPQKKDMTKAYKNNIAGYIVKNGMDVGFGEALVMLESYCQRVVLPS